MVIRAKFFIVREKISKRERLKRTLHHWIGIRPVNINSWLLIYMEIDIGACMYVCACMQRLEYIHIFWLWC